MQNRKKKATLFRVVPEEESINECLTSALKSVEVIIAHGQYLLPVSQSTGTLSRYQDGLQILHPSGL